jgi:hypothetical protein
MKVLFTGMASSHAKPSSASTTFFSVLSQRVDAVVDDVEWKSPSLTWSKDYLEQYDAIFVGMLPPTSLSANKLYGAMHVINLMFDSPKLNLVLDHPQLWQYKHGFNAIDRSVENVFGGFYAKRSEFSLAKDSYSKSIVGANAKLLTKKWPRTLYPSLPWKVTRPIDKFLGLYAEQSLTGLNFDSWLLDGIEYNPLASHEARWVVDHPNSTWSKSISKLLELPISPLSTKTRSTDAEALSAIQDAAGLLFSPQDRGVGGWWSYRLVQAIASGTFVMSDWKETGVLGPEWNLLGYDWESLPKSDKLAVADAQRESYSNSIPSKSDSENSLSLILESSQKGEKNARS